MSASQGNKMDVEMFRAYEGCLNMPWPYNNISGFHRNGHNIWHTGRLSLQQVNVHPTKYLIEKIALPPTPQKPFQSLNDY